MRSLRSTPRTSSAGGLRGLQFVAGSRGQLYYRAGCNAARQLLTSRHDLLRWDRDGALRVASLRRCFSDCHNS